LIRFALGRFFVALGCGIWLRRGALPPIWQLEKNRLSVAGCQEEAPSLVRLTWRFRRHWRMEDFVGPLFFA
jgi:hypothetical protein